MDPHRHCIEDYYKATVEGVLRIYIHYENPIDLKVVMQGISPFSQEIDIGTHTIGDHSAVFFYTFDAFFTRMMHYATH